MKKKIIILGTGGNCIDILDTINDINRLDYQYECLGFLDDDEKKKNMSFNDLPVLGKLHDAKKFFNQAYFINGIGNPYTFYKKEAILKRTKIPMDKFITLIHPTASVSSLAEIGKGSIIFQNVTITSNVKIGNHVMILPNSVVSHDDFLDDYVTLAAGVKISGNVHIDKLTYIGTNASIIGNVKIENNCLIGMGSVVLSDCKSHSIYVGNPAKFLRKLNNGF